MKSKKKLSAESLTNDEMKKVTGGGFTDLDSGWIGGGGGSAAETPCNKRSTCGGQCTGSNGKIGECKVVPISFKCLCFT